jgi:uncharacterized oligopeptide transporter (OPT) family protein
MELKSVGIWSCGKMLGAMYFLIGLLLGGFFAVIATLGIAVDQANGGNPAAFPMMGVGAVIFFPIAYGLGGLIGGILMAAIYNLVAGLVGGIELNFDTQTQEIQY